MSESRADRLTIIHTVAGLAADHGGPSRSIPGLCRALADRELDVHLVTSEDRRSTIPEAGSATVWRLPSRGWLTWRNGLGRIVEDVTGRRGRCILHDHGLWLPSNAAVSSVAGRRGIPLVISPRGMLEPWSMQYRRFRKATAWKLYQSRYLRGASMIHATSELERHNLAQLGLTTNVVVVPNGIVVPPSDRKPEAARSPRVALFLSRLHPKKGVEMLLKAWSEVRPEGWVLRIAGSGEDAYETSLKTKARDLGLAESAVFLGPVDDEHKWAVYRDADLFILPTFSENFGLVIAEALGSGVPVLTTTATPWEEVRDHACGWWIDPRPDALAETLRQATTASPAELVEMGKRGRALILERYSWDGIAVTFETIYRELALKSQVTGQI